MEIGFIIVMAAIVAICYLLVMHHQDRKKEEDRVKKRCGNCKHFGERSRDDAHKNLCTLFFKTEYPDSLCHRWASKEEQGDED